jgi:hypothetical protein
MAKTTKKPAPIPDDDLAQALTANGTEPLRVKCPHCAVELLVRLPAEGQPAWAVTLERSRLGGGLGPGALIGLAGNGMPVCPVCDAHVAMTPLEAEVLTIAPAPAAAAEPTPTLPIDEPAPEPGPSAETADASGAEASPRAPETATEAPADTPLEAPATETEEPVETQAAPSPAATDEPKQIPLFAPPPFDADSALHEIALKNRDMATARAAYEESKGETARLKKEWELEAKSLEDLIMTFEDRRRDADRRGAPRLVATLVKGAATAAPEDAAPQVNPEAVKPGCLFERETGKPCPICRDRKPGLVATDVRNPMHPDHGYIAGELAKDEAVQRQLLEAGVHLDLQDVEDLSLGDQERDEILAWASAVVLARTADSSVTVPVRPAALGTPHEAAAAEGSSQACRVCGIALWNTTDRDEAGQDFYPAGALVGTDCEGEPPQEEARPVAKRGSKKGRKKHEPEKIAAEQRRVAPIDVPDVVDVPPAAPEAQTSELPPAA